LISGLDKLYSNVNPIDSRLKYGEILSESHSKLFQWNTLNLPYVTTTKLKGKVLPNCAFHDLGDNIRHMHLSIYKVLPSSVIIQIQVYLDEKLSEKINNVIYKYHKEERKPIETPKGGYTKTYGPEHQKESQIYQLRRELHTEAVDFLRGYFEGYFFELAKDDVSVVPVIDLFSLDYPIDEEKILNWGRKYSGFFSCLDVHINPFDCFIYENYLFCVESKHDVEFKNYNVFANRKTSSNNMYHDIDSAIEEKLNFCSFDLFAIDRWVKIQENVVGKLNLTVSEEISKIQENNFGEAIKTRGNVLKNIFSFERFVAEYQRYNFPHKFPFKNLKDKRNPYRQIELFKGLKEGITSRINVITDLINNFTRQYETIINLKNVEFSKKMQDIILVLTIAIISLTLIQIFKSEIVDFIVSLFHYFGTS
jgi:hypothetical protein